MFQRIFITLNLTLSPDLKLTHLGSNKIDCGTKLLGVAKRVQKAPNGLDVRARVMIDG